MKGFIDESGRALLSLTVKPEKAHAGVATEVWVDTGFTGELVLPQSFIESLALPLSGSVDALLADGSQVELKTYTCFLNWFGKERRLEIVANHGSYPLLGVGLLLGLELHVNYHLLQLTLEAP